MFFPSRARLASWHPPMQRRRNLENSAVPTLLARGSRLAFRAIAGSTTGHLATTTKLAQQRGHPSTRLPPAVRPVPVELSRSQHHGAGLQLAALNSIDRYHLRVIAG